MCRARRPAACSACRHAQRAPDTTSRKQACCLTDRTCGVRSCLRNDASRVRHDRPPLRGSIRSPIFRCRCMPLSRFVVDIDRGCVERHRPNRKACAMRRGPAPGKRLGRTPGVMREGIDGNVSGTHLFSARERRGRCREATHRALRRAPAKRARPSASTKPRRPASACGTTRPGKMFHRRDPARAMRGQRDVIPRCRSG